MLAALAKPKLQHPRDAFQSLSGLLDAIQPRLNSESAKREVDEFSASVNNGIVIDDSAGFSVEDLALEAKTGIDSLFERLRKTL